ncbi:MAG: ribose transport system ATP-binding protein [Thermomicrobiales bacterium]|jgi:ribose transport system ATP-binding protein|nr:ribose transport system ATP-binding protein [Thermomicrobiales bacterium]
MTDLDPILVTRNIHKRFPGVHALDDVSISAYPGAVLAVIGENGAGKSTLMKVLAGAIHPDEGVIEIDDQPVVLSSPRRAQELGVGIIYQELSLVDALSVGENIFLGDLPRHPWVPGKVDWPELWRRTAELLERVGARVGAKTLVRTLSVAQKQMVEIARALATNVRVLILDEPTSSLTAKETATLFGIIASLRARGVAIIYISHRLEEVFAIAQRVTVLRDGRLVGTIPIEEATHERLIGMMVGRDLSDLFVRAPESYGPVRLEVRGLRRTGVLEDVSFAVRPGEILGVAGLVGSGRTELMRSIFGADRLDGGEILFDGKPVRIRSPRDAVRLGIGLVPEDRKLQALFLGMAVRENISLPVLTRLGSPAFPSRARERSLVSGYIDSFRIRTPSMEQRVRALSGGNQQKVVIARWLATEPKVLILDEPTRGIDIGAKAEVHALIAHLAEQGVAIIMVSSELPEILGMSHRVLVMRQGRIAADIPRAEATEERIMTAATGQAPLVA